MHAFWLILPWFFVVMLATALAWRIRSGRRDAALRVQQRAELQDTALTLARVRQAVESASDAIGIGDMEGHSLYHNRAHIALFGYSVAELNAVPGGGVLFADAIVANAIHAAIRGGHSWAGETEVRAHGGRVIPCFVRADIIRDEAERPVGIFGVFTDITARRRAEQELEEQRQRLLVTLQSIGDAVIATDTAGRIILLNAVAEHYTGWTQVRATGRLLDEVLYLLDERTRARRASGVARLLGEKMKHTRSADAFVLVGPGGAERLVAENAALIVTADQEVAGAVLALRDISRERKRAEEVSRAGKLESLGLMAGSIAHDFGNLLTSIAANVSLAMHVDGLPAAARGRLDEADRAVWRARDVTQQLTTFSKGGTTRKKVVALPALLREGTGFAVQSTRVQARFQFAEDLWPVEADESQLIQVINNLAVNAVQAMAQGGTLLVAAENQAPEADTAFGRGDRWVKIAVIDTGSGIAPENLAKIFEPFFTTKAAGSGFGLATSYAIVKKHGGQMRVESAVGRGTTFHILLPAAAGERTASASPFPGADDGERSLGRVLVMDDDEPMRESIGLMLGLLNYESVEAADGAEAMEKYTAARARGRPFDAVVFDLRVSEGLGGAEVARRLRALDPGFRAIAISAYAEEEIFTDCRAHGFGAALLKPFKMTQLGAALQTVLAGRKPG